MLTMTRIGKIARLPHKIRDELNSRLLDGHRAKDLVPWLNSLDETKRLIDFAFNGNPISEQNVSDWRQGGYQDWLRNRSTRERIGRFLDLSAQLQSPFHDDLIPERLSALPTAELASGTTQILAEIEDPRERFRSLKLLHAANAIAARELRQRHNREKAEDPLMAGMRAHDRGAFVERPIQTYSNLFKPIQTYSNLIKPDQT